MQLAGFVFWVVLWCFVRVAGVCCLRFVSIYWFDWWLMWVCLVNLVGRVILVLDFTVWVFGVGVACCGFGFS